MCVYLHCIHSGYEQEAYPNAACPPCWAVLVVSAWEGAVGKGGCSYLLLVPLECQESSRIPVICWKSLGMAPGLPLSIAPLASPALFKEIAWKLRSTPKCIQLPKAFLPPFHRKLRGQGVWLAAPAGVQHPAALSTAGLGAPHSEIS